MVKDQNIYEYKKVKPMEYSKQIKPENPFDNIIKHQYGDKEKFKAIKDKVNELVVEQNHLQKDLELYKKSYKTLLFDFNILLSAVEQHPELGATFKRIYDARLKENTLSP